VLAVHSVLDKGLGLLLFAMVSWYDRESAPATPSQDDELESASPNDAPDAPPDPEDPDQVIVSDPDVQNTTSGPAS
jgi:hypothetical protein